MTIWERWRDLGRTRTQRLVLLIVGSLLVIVSPVVGAIPGPGGIIVFAAGFGMMLKASRWVKKRYARFKLRHPKKGEWADFGLQRGSYKRRQARAKELAAASAEAESKVDLGKHDSPCDR
ncbi:MAG TPA: hypothetical protein VGB54_08155 [Allosphingosinicella sp.]|jgi:hypothetical protein